MTTLSHVALESLQLHMTVQSCTEQWQKNQLNYTTQSSFLGDEQSTVQRKENVLNDE